MTPGSDDTASESDRPPDASRRAFVRAVAKSIARSLLVVTVLVAVYYLVPVDASDTGAIVVRCIGAIVVIPAVWCGNCTRSTDRTGRNCGRWKGWRPP
jgi:hypothetical protein